MPELIRIDSHSPLPAALGRIIDILKGGGVIAYPTETFYGLGADAFNPAAVEKIFEIKGRAQRNPIPLIIGRLDLLAGLVLEIPGIATKLIEKFWPGPLTLVFRAAPTINPALTGGSGKIGIRLSSHQLARKLSEGISGPLTATSANLSGAGESTSASEVLLGLNDRISAVADGGATPGGKGSTVIDITVDPPVFFRHGAISAKAIKDTLGRTV